MKPVMESITFFKSNYIALENYNYNYVTMENYQLQLNY